MTKANDRTEVVRVATMEPPINTEDIEATMRLESLGYAQELRRDFSPLAVFGFSFSIMGVVPSIASTIFYNLPYGGPVAMSWGWLIAAVLILFVGMAMADLASSMPTSGGLYFWTHRLGPAKYRNFLAWLVGYSSFLGNITAVSSLSWAAAGIFLAAASLNDPNFNATTAIQFGLFLGILVFVGIACAWGTEIINRLQTASIILNALLILVTIIGLPIGMRHQLNTAEYTFGSYENLTGWNNGFAFILSFLAPVWTICSFDSAVSISEEANNAATAVPWAIVGAISSAGITGFIIMLILSLCMGPSLALVYDNNQPLAFIYLQAFGTKGSLVLWSFMCVAQLFMTISLALPASRQAFAFARDGALPFSSYFYNVSKVSGTPVRTVWLIVGLSAPLGALAFANIQAINAIFSLAIIGPYCAYGIPIACRIFAEDGLFVPGPWYLGRASKPVAVVALVWMTFACVIFCFPADTGTTASTMNYAVVVWAAVFAFATGYWFFPRIGGRTFFRGPITHPHHPEDLDYSSTQNGHAMVVHRTESQSENQSEDQIPMKD